MKYGAKANETMTNSASSLTFLRNRGLIAKQPTPLVSIASNMKLVDHQKYSLKLKKQKEKPNKLPRHALKNHRLGTRLNNLGSELFL